MMFFQILTVLPLLALMATATAWPPACGSDGGVCGPGGLKERSPEGCAGGCPAEFLCVKNKCEAIHILRDRGDELKDRNGCGQPCLGSGECIGSCTTCLAGFCQA